MLNSRLGRLQTVLGPIEVDLSNGELAGRLQQTATTLSTYRMQVVRLMQGRRDKIKKRKHTATAKEAEAAKLIS